MARCVPEMRPKTRAPPRCDGAAGRDTRRSPSDPTTSWPPDRPRNGSCHPRCPQRAPIRGDPGRRRRLPPRQFLTLLVTAAAAIAIVVGGVDVVERARLPRPVQQRLRPRRRRDHRSAGQMNVPYKFAEGGGAILVPAQQVHEMRLQARVAGPAQGRRRRLRADGQPEVRHHPVPGAGQLPARARRRARALDPVAVGRARRARAPRDSQAQSVFLREQQKPTASVVLTCMPGARSTVRRSAPSSTWSRAACPSSRRRTSASSTRTARCCRAAPRRRRRGLDAAQLKYVKQIEQGDDPAHRRHPRADRRPRQRARAGHRRRRFQPRRSGRRDVQAEPGGEGRGAAQPADQRSRQHGAAPARRGVPGALSNQPPAAGVAPIDGEPPRPASPSTGDAAVQHAQGRDDQLRSRQDDRAHDARPSARSSA